MPRRSPRASRINYFGSTAHRNKKILLLLLLHVLLIKIRKTVFFIEKICGKNAKSLILNCIYENIVSNSDINFACAGGCFDDALAQHE